MSIACRHNRNHPCHQLERSDGLLSLPWDGRWTLSVGLVTLLDIAKDDKVSLGESLISEAPYKSAVQPDPRGLHASISSGAHPKPLSGFALTSVDDDRVPLSWRDLDMSNIRPEDRCVIRFDHLHHMVIDRDDVVLYKISGEADNGRTMGPDIDDPESYTLVDGNLHFDNLGR